MLSEATIIASLKSQSLGFIGDDAAVIPLNQEENYVITKDLLVEDVHFRTRYFSPENLAHKALHVNLSDLAAMGACPKYILLGISIPDSMQTYIEEFLHHFARICLEERVILIGGDTTKSPDKLFISVTAIGMANTTSVKYRHTAKSGDIICVAGAFGEAHLGLVSLERFLTKFEVYQNAYLSPAAKIQEGIWLAAESTITAMMDLSDGLFVDLKKLCDSSAVQGVIALDRLCPSEIFTEACHDLDLDPQEAQLIGGEDYGLLLTVDATEYEALSKKFKQHFGYDLKRIGSITEGEGVCFTDHGTPTDLKLVPFSHFKELI